MGSPLIGGTSDRADKVVTKMSGEKGRGPSERGRGIERRAETIDPGEWVFKILNRLIMGGPINNQNHQLARGANHWRGSQKRWTEVVQRGVYGKKGVCNTEGIGTSLKSEKNWVGREKLTTRHIQFFCVGVSKKISKRGSDWRGVIAGKFGCSLRQASFVREEKPLKQNKLRGRKLQRRKPREEKGLQGNVGKNASPAAVLRGFIDGRHPGGGKFREAGNHRKKGRRQTRKYINSPRKLYGEADVVSAKRKKGLRIDHQPKGLKQDE